MEKVAREIHNANLLAKQTEQLEKSLAAIKKQKYTDLDKNNVALLESKIKQNRHNLNNGISNVYNGEPIQSRITTK